MPQWEATLHQAEDLVQQLEVIYAGQRQRTIDLAESRRQEKRGIAGFFRTLIPAPQVMEPEHQRFMDQAEALARDLARLLDQLPGQLPQIHTLAEQAVACYLAPKPLEDKSPEEWFMTAAEGFCLPLVPYLTPEAAGRFHDAVLKSTPKRYLFPKQQEVLRALAELAG